MRDSNQLNRYIGMQIKKYRLRKHMTAEDLAEKVGLSRATITRYESGTRGTTQNSLFKLSKALGVSVDEFFPDHADSENSDNGLPYNVEYLYNSDNHAVRIPIIGSIAMGSPITAEQNVEGYTTEVFSSLPSGTLFALLCKGHSMEPTIPNGALAIIRQQSDVEDNEIAAVQVNNDCEATLKRVQHQGSQIILMPDNKDYKPIVLSKNYPGRIVGKLIRYSVDLDNPRQD